jgi:ribose transport system permease protein
MVYQFGPDERILFWLGGGDIWRVPNVVIVMLILALIMGFLFHYTSWGRYVYGS